uniref:ATP-dependent Clp protease proteolytic subunit n=1 Tax=Stenocereus thurberi TaxID=171973 RepID=UPI00220921CA|nr:ATP-dependent Clp protease proteolytic subunit [Stenocereus thurberi]UXN84246.1 ATP-dependent Clp protease proteolytic subunit [Stenocereus thurberi]
MLDLPPQVPVRLPGEEETSWVDITDQLNRNRILFLCEEIDAEISNDIIGLILYLGMEDNTQDLHLFINSTGGEIINGMTIYNIMQFVPTAVSTICLGMAASMASYILVGGEYKKRVAFPHARVMIHQPSAYFISEDDKQEVSTLFGELEELVAIRETITRGYSERTGKPVWIISQDMERDFFMSATEAKAYGIVDLIKGTSKKQNI